MRCSRWSRTGWWHPDPKRQMVEWTAVDVVMPDGWSAPSLDQYYRKLNAVADAADYTCRRICIRGCAT